MNERNNRWLLLACGAKYQTTFLQFHAMQNFPVCLDELRSAKQELEQAGVTIDGMSDHTVSQSLYLKDPDGNEVELYVDADESLWKNNSAAVLSPIKPLLL